jgi:hypothetical protein
LVAAIILQVKIDDSFSGKALPEDYAIAQITITIRTIVSGLAYLATFVFGANALGLFLLACKTLVTGVSDVVSPSSASASLSAARGGGGSSAQVRCCLSRLERGRYTECEEQRSRPHNEESGCA